MCRRKGGTYQISLKSAPDALDGGCVAVACRDGTGCAAPCKSTRECVLVVLPSRIRLVVLLAVLLTLPSRSTLTVRGSWLVVRAPVRSLRRVCAPVARQASDSRSS